MDELPNSVAARKDRRLPRVKLSREGQDAVLRGAAALVVANVLSPQFGQMFTQDPPRSGRDPLLQERAA
jgi:hypothetical protein